MKIAMILTNSFNPDVRVYKEAVYLTGQGHRVTILCWDRDKKTTLLQKEEVDGIEVVRFRIPSIAGTGYKQLGAYWKYVKACRNYLEKHEVDYVHCHDLDGMMAYRLTRGRAPYVFDMHEYYISGSPYKKKIVRELLRRLIKKSHYSLYENDGYLKLYDEKVNEMLLPLKNYPDTYLQKLEKTASDKLRIGYHGCVRSQIPEFTALFEACKEMENVRIDINGGGIDLEKLQQLSKKYKNVYIHGPYDGIKESSALYQNTDLLYCGYNPTHPNYQGDAEVVKFYEAIITGTPMMMTETLGMGQKIRDMNIGVTVNTRDSEAIRQKVMDILKFPEQLNVLRNNMEKYADNYTWGEAVQVLDKVYK